MSSESISPSISIVLPAYNRVQYLREAVDSVFAQTFQDWELIVADDGSDVETAGYLAGLQKIPRVEILWRGHSGNPSVVRNAAIRVARGTYVAFLDSDDLWLPTKLERQLASHQSHPACRWSYVAMERVYEDGILMKGEPHRATPEGAIFPHLLALRANVSMSSIMVERDYLVQVGCFDETQRFFEDFEIFLRLSLGSQVSVVRQPLVRMRNHQQHYSADRISMLEGRAQLLRKMQPFAERLGLAELVYREQDRNGSDLARVHAAHGHRGEALCLLWRSRDVWQEACWWRAWSAAVKSLVPNYVRRAYRRFRYRSPAAA
ncbi:MAG: glycosyltransferase family 2 protein [Terriglobales bacterium]